jgi:hypothetical protein
MDFFKAPWMPFKNECLACGCSDGVLSYNWSRKNTGEKVPAHYYAHTIFSFRCSSCGTITVYEYLPMITRILTKDEYEVNDG